VHVTDYTILGGVQRIVYTAIYLKLGGPAYMPGGYA
jgi:hypothetical protein